MSGMIILSTSHDTTVDRNIVDMLDGKIEPENVKIEGIDSPEEVTIQKERAAAEAGRRAWRSKQKRPKNFLLACREENHHRRRRNAGGQVLWTYSKTRTDNSFEESSNLGVDEMMADRSNSKVASRYNFDYSRWDQCMGVVQRRGHCCGTGRERSIRRKKTKFFFAIKSSKRTRRNSARISLPTWKIERRRTATAKKQESADILRIKGNNCLFQGQEVRELFGALYGCAKGHPIWCEDLNQYCAGFNQTEAYRRRSGILGANAVYRCMPVMSRFVSVKQSSMPERKSKSIE